MGSLSWKINLQVAPGSPVLSLNSAMNTVKGLKTMPHFALKSSLKAHAPKALVAILVALIVCSNVPLTAGSKSEVDPRLTSATSRFALKLYDRIPKGDTSKNTFVSPMSIMLALAMTYNGSYEIGRARVGKECRS